MVNVFGQAGFLRQVPLAGSLGIITPTPGGGSFAPSKCEQITGLLDRYNCEREEIRRRLQPPVSTHGVAPRPERTPSASEPTLSPGQYEKLCELVEVAMSGSERDANDAAETIRKWMASLPGEWYDENSAKGRLYGRIVAQCPNGAKFLNIYTPYWPKCPPGYIRDQNTGKCLPPVPTVDTRPLPGPGPYTPPGKSVPSVDLFNRPIDTSIPWVPPSMPLTPTYGGMQTAYYGQQESFGGGAMTESYGGTSDCPPGQVPDPYSGGCMTPSGGGYGGGYGGLINFGGGAMTASGFGMGGRYRVANLGAL